MMHILRKYEKVSDQLINLDKSFLYLDDKVPVGVSNQIRRITGIKQGSLSFVYLGRPVFYSRKNKGYFEELIKKVFKRLSMWQNKLLYFGGRYILNKHIPQSIPIYLL